MRLERRGAFEGARLSQVLVKTHGFFTNKSHLRNLSLGVPKHAR